MLMLFGIQSIAIAYDIPPPQRAKQQVKTDDRTEVAAASATDQQIVSQAGTVVGGVLMALAILCSGLWLVRSRKVSSKNLPVDGA